MPDDAEVAGLLALMLLHDSRRAARVDAHGELVALDDQDRALWDRGRIHEGDRMLRAALRRGRPGPYQLQAAIAALHATSPSPEETDHAQIAALYGELARRTPSAVIDVNRAAALGRAGRPGDGLALLAPLLADRALATLRARCTPPTPTCSNAAATTPAPRARTRSRPAARTTRSRAPSCCGARPPARDGGDAVPCPAWPTRSFASPVRPACSPPRPTAGSRRCSRRVSSRCSSTTAGSMRSRSSPTRSISSRCRCCARSSRASSRRRRS